MTGRAASTAERLAALDAGEIERSLEIAAARGGDLTGLVYARLFAARPEMEALFVRDTNGAVRGEMLARVFEMVVDFIGRGAYAGRMVQCEVITHEGYGVPPEVFSLFFDVVADAVRDCAGEAWTDRTEAAWATLLDGLRRFAANPDQSVDLEVAR